MKRVLREEGKEVDGDGKEHTISRETCVDCGNVIMEYHYNCCGYGMSGFKSLFCYKCADQEVRDVS